MSVNPQGGGFQQQVLRSFTALMLLRRSWAGEFILGVGLNDEGAALALGAHIAGAVCLAVEPDVALVKAAQRRGACDFAVNTLDEALRTMKNEVRLGRALSVALHGDYSATLTEAVERGLLPALIFGRAGDLPEAAAEAVGRLQQLGSALVCFRGCGAAGCTDADGFVETWTAHNGFRIHTIAAANASDVAALDGILRGQLGSGESEGEAAVSGGHLVGQPASGDAVRRLWLERARQHFLRERPLGRVVWLTDAEAEELRRGGRAIVTR